MLPEFKARIQAFVNADDRGQLGIFMVLVLGAVALVVVSIVLLFGMQIGGSFADGVGDSFSATEDFTTSSASPVEYTVNRTTADDDVVRLDGTVTVYNETSGTELTDGTDYEWFPDNGTLSIQDGSSAVTRTYNVTYSGDESEYGSATRSTTDSTGDAFELFGTSVLVIPAAAVLAVLIGGMVGAISGRANLPGFGNSRNRRRRR